MQKVIFIISLWIPMLYAAEYEKTTEIDYNDVLVETVQCLEQGRLSGTQLQHAIVSLSLLNKVKYIDVSFKERKAFAHLTDTEITDWLNAIQPEVQKTQEQTIKHLISTELLRIAMLAKSAISDEVIQQLLAAGAQPNEKRCMAFILQQESGNTGRFSEPCVIALDMVSPLEIAITKGKGNAVGLFHKALGLD